MTSTHVVAVCGSLREGSYTRIALEHALAEAQATGATTELLDLREYDLPLLDPGAEAPPDATALTRAVRKADGIVLGTPMYHGSYSSTLKVALDYCGFDEFENSTVGLLAVAGGSFPLSALNHLRIVCRALNAWVLPHQAAIPNVRGQFDGEEFADDRTAERTRTLGRRVVEFAHIEPDPPSPESLQNVGANRSRD